MDIDGFDSYHRKERKRRIPKQSYFEHTQEHMAATVLPALLFPKGNTNAVEHSQEKTI